MLRIKERKERQQFREDLRKKGIIPPKKKPLNRKKFVQHVKNIIEGEQKPNYYSIARVLLMHFPFYEDRKITDEQITVAKIVYGAYLHESFIKEVKDRGDSEYKMDEYYEKVFRKVEEL